MKPKTVYLALCFAGALLPYWQFVPWLLEHGLNGPLFLRELFANRISTFFAMDVLVSAVVLLRFIRVERLRLDIRHWWLPIVAVLVVGVSLGLPMFLYMREVRLERGDSLNNVKTG
jgi:Terpene cyclase DEP1